jgi:threonine dehydrogenase-like Zn-dependent dehydrogenase
MYGAGDVRVESTPDPEILEPTDALVRVTLACVCGSDLHPFHNRAADSARVTMGHEFIGVIEDVGSEVATLAKGDFVIAPFVYSDNTCELCVEGFQTSCLHGGGWNRLAERTGGGQAEAVRVPLADGTLVKVPGPVDDALLPSLLSLSDVYGTGFHAVRQAHVGPGSTVTVIGDGAVGLMAVLSAKRLGAERIILMGRHASRTDLGIEFGATDVVAERGDEGVARVKELTNGLGTHAVIEAVGFEAAYVQALGAVRSGGTISRVGVPQFKGAFAGYDSMFWRNITLTGGPAPVRSYIPDLLEGVLDGSVNPGKVFDLTVSLDDIASGYAAMDDRSALKVIVRP